MLPASRRDSGRMQENTCSVSHTCREGCRCTGMHDYHCYRMLKQHHYDFHIPLSVPCYIQQPLMKPRINL